MRSHIYLVIIFAFAYPKISGAHDFWIEPNQFQIPKNEQVNITLREGVDLKGNSLPYITEWFSDFSFTDGEGKHVVKSELGNDPAATLTPSSGTTLLGYHSTRDFVSLKADKFAKYLEQEGMEYILPQRKARDEENKDAKEYYVRCAKTLLQSGPNNDNEIYRTRLGYTLEVMPETNPHKLKPGEILSLQLLYLGNPIEGVRIRAFTKGEPNTNMDNRTDSEGRVKLKLPRKGIWLIKAVHMVPIENDLKARWESFWASLLFELK